MNGSRLWHIITSRPNPQLRKIPVLIDLLDIDGDGLLDDGLGGGVFGVGVADPHVFPALLVDVDDVADDQAGLVGAGGEAEGDFPVVAAALRAGCAQEQNLAGIQGGDVIVRLNDKPITGLRSLLDVLGASRPGQKVKITANRDGKRMRLEVTLGRRSQ